MQKLDVESIALQLGRLVGELDVVLSSEPYGDDDEDASDSVVSLHSEMKDFALCLSDNEAWSDITVAAQALAVPLCSRWQQAVAICARIDAGLASRPGLYTAFSQVSQSRWDVHGGPQAAAELAHSLVQTIARFPDAWEVQQAAMCALATLLRLLERGPGAFASPALHAVATAIASPAGANVLVAAVLSLRDGRTVREAYFVIASVRSGLYGAVREGAAEAMSSAAAAAASIDSLLLAAGLVPALVGTFCMVLAQYDAADGDRCAGWGGRADRNIRAIIIAQIDLILCCDGSPALSAACVHALRHEAKAAARAFARALRNEVEEWAEWSSSGVTAPEHRGAQELERAVFGALDGKNGKVFFRFVDGLRSVLGPAASVDGAQNVPQVAFAINFRQAAGLQAVLQAIDALLKADTGDSSLSQRSAAQALESAFDLVLKTLAAAPLHLHSSVAATSAMVHKYRLDEVTALNLAASAMSWQSQHSIGARRGSLPSAEHSESVLLPGVRAAAMLVLGELLRSTDSSAAAPQPTGSSGVTHQTPLWKSGDDLTNAAYRATCVFLSAGFNGGLREQQSLRSAVLRVVSAAHWSKAPSAQRGEETLQLGIVTIACQVR